MKPPFPSMTPTWHRECYPSIDPAGIRLSCQGKTVVVTGAGSGIGRSIALAFADAGAKHVALIGRTTSTLEETAGLIGRKSSWCRLSSTSIHTTSVTDAKGLQAAAAQIGTWDVMVLNAGISADLVPIMDVDNGEWWETFETNVKGTFLMTKTFHATASSTRPILLSVSSAAVTWPPEMTPGYSAYTPSKVAQWSFINFVKAENPTWHVVSFHPGILVTNMTIKSGVAESGMPMDDLRLPGDFAVWLASQEATFLNGKFVWANWDVDELKEQAKEIEGSALLTPTISGAPHPHGG